MVSRWHSTATRVVFFALTKMLRAVTVGQTQFGRAMNEKSITGICANTSFAKDRVEQAHLTLQDRLVSS